MKPSGPHSSTMGIGECSSIPTVVFRVWGHPEIGPKPVSDQSRTRMSAPTSPPPKGKLSLFPELAMCSWKLEKADFCNVKVALYTSGERASSLATGTEGRSFLGTCDHNRLAAVRPLLSKSWGWVGGSPYRVTALLLFGLPNYLASYHQDFCPEPCEPRKQQQLWFDDSE